MADKYDAQEALMRIMTCKMKVSFSEDVLVQENFYYEIIGNTVIRDASNVTHIS